MSINEDMNINKLKLEVISDTLSNLTPEEGEIISIRGGLGSRVIYQYKKDEGLFYRRYSEDEQWEEFDLMGMRLESLQDMKSGLHDFDKQGKSGVAFKLKRFLKNIFK